MPMIKVDFYKASLFGELVLKFIETILKEFWFKFKYLSSGQKHNNKEQELCRWIHDEQLL